MQISSLTICTTIFHNINLGPAHPELTGPKAKYGNSDVQQMTVNCRSFRPFAGLRINIRKFCDTFSFNEKVVGWESFGRSQTIGPDRRMATTMKFMITSIECSLAVMAEMATRCRFIDLVGEGFM